VSQGSVLAHSRLSPTVSIPDNWCETPQFTIEFACKGFSSGQMPAGSNVCGVGILPDPVPASGLGVWTLTTTTANTYQLTLYTQTTRNGRATPHQFTRMLPRYGVVPIPPRGAKAGRTARGSRAGVTYVPPGCDPRPDVGVGRIRDVRLRDRGRLLGRGRARGEPRAVREGRDAHHGCPSP
jgi:hypothetical protein